MTLQTERKREEKLKEITRWLDLNRCLVIFRKGSKIIFSANGKTCMLFVKSTNRPPSRRLKEELENYRKYNIKAEAIYDVYEMDQFI